MGREVRRVPADWQHPKRANGDYIPLHGRSFSKEAAEWNEGLAQWLKGFRSDYEGGWRPKEEKYEGMIYDDWSGSRPDEDDYMPDWPDEQRTHLQMYEDTSEGTPISPVMATPEELASWLVDNNASAFGGMTASYEQWLATIKRGFACSAVMTVNSDGTGTMESGVAALAENS